MASSHIADTDPQAPISLGFVKLWDAAPILVAAAEGYFANLGLSVNLSRELGWSTIREKIIHRELDFAHALGPMPLTLSLGLEGAAVPCLGLMALNRNGDGVTLARRHWDNGIRSAAEFSDFVVREKWRRRFVLAVVGRCSSHQFLLQQWLSEIKLRPRREVEIVQLPPGQFLRNLAAGTIDGACVGEPWNSLAVLERSGWLVANSLEIAANHPEKTILATRATLEANPDRAARLVAAISLGAERCDDPAFQPRLLEILSVESALNLPLATLRKILQLPAGPAASPPLAGLRFTGGDLPLWDKHDFQWIEAGLRQAEILDVPIPGGNFGLDRFYPDAVVKNAQPYLKALKQSISSAS